MLLSKLSKDYPRIQSLIIEPHGNGNEYIGLMGKSMQPQIKLILQQQTSKNAVKCYQLFLMQ